MWMVDTNKWHCIFSLFTVDFNLGLPKHASSGCR